jgi:hypothetical protein
MSDNTSACRHTVELIRTHAERLVLEELERNG